MREKYRQSYPGLYLRYIRILALSQLQYRGWMLGLLPNLIYVLTDPVDALLLLDRFGAVGGFTPSAVMLLYGMAILSFGLAELTLRGVDYFPMLVRSGEFDRVLLRPRAALFQVCVLRFHLNRLNRVVCGALLMGFCLAAQGARPTAGNILMLVLAILGGMLCYDALLLIQAALAFFTVREMNVFNVFTHGSFQVVKLPPDQMPRWMRGAFSFLMPLLLFTYYPAGAVCGWGTPQPFGWLALPAGAVFFALACILWRTGMRHYQSTGS